MGGVDIVDQMHRFYTCTHKSSPRSYLWLFWFLLDLTIDTVYILNAAFRIGLLVKVGMYNNKVFCKELVMELLSKYSSQTLRSCQVKIPPARLSQQHFTDSLGTDK